MNVIQLVSESNEFTNIFGWSWTYASGRWDCSRSGKFEKIYLDKLTLNVVYFDLRLGAVHSNCWSSVF